jgi:hydroxyacylglutathione hydrolase
LELVGSGAQLLDTREPAKFEGAHVRGAVNVGVGGSYATWCGTILDRNRPIVLISEPGREAEAATRLGRIGFDSVAGYLAGGMQPLNDARELIDRTPRLTAAALAEQLSSPDPPLLIDVRTEREWQAARIDGAVNILLSRLTEGTTRLSGARPLVVYCASGYRSAIASSLTSRAGLRDVAGLVGGTAAWESARLATVSANPS